MAPFFLLLFGTLLLFFIQGAFSFSNFFFHRVLQNISLFLCGRDSLKMISNIIICIVIFKAIVKYRKTLKFVRGIINIFKKRSNFVGTLKSNKLFYLLCIVKIIISLSIEVEVSSSLYSHWKARCLFLIKQQDSSLQKDILYIEHKFLAYSYSWCICFHKCIPFETSGVLCTTFVDPQ